MSIIITDQEKISVSRAVNYLITPSEESEESLREVAALHVGALYGQRRATGQSHADAVAAVEWQMAKWYSRPAQFCSVSPNTPLVTIEDAEVIALGDAVLPVIREEQGAVSLASIVDIGSQYGVLRQQQKPHDKSTATCRAVAYEWYGRTVPVNSLPSVYPKIQGRLRIQNGCFVDDAGPTLPLFCHAGDLFALWIRNSVRATEQLKVVADAGYQGIRVWTLLDGFFPGNWWTSKDRNVGPTMFSSYWTELERFMQTVNTLGLKLALSQGDIGQLGTDMEKRKAFARRVAATAKAADGTGHVVAFFDGGNEAWQTGEPDPVRLAAFVQAYRDGGGTALLTLTSPPGEEVAELNAFSIDPADIYDVHGYRGGRFYDKIRHIFSIAYEGLPKRRLGIQSEPAGSGTLVSVTDNINELNHAAVGLLGVMSLLTRQAWVWFSGEGVWVQAGLETEAGFANTPKLCALLPKDLMQFQSLQHSGETWAKTRLVDRGISHECRMDGARHTDGRFVYLFYGVPGTHTFRAARKFSGTFYHPETLVAEPVSYNAGDSFTLSWDRGLVFIGTV